MAGMSLSKENHSLTLKQRLEEWVCQVVSRESVDGPQAAYFRGRQIQALIRLVPLMMTGTAINTLVICWVFWG